MSETYSIPKIGHEQEQSRDLRINVIITTVVEAGSSQAKYIRLSFLLHLSWVFCGFTLGIAALAVL